MLKYIAVLLLFVYACGSCWAIVYVDASAPGPLQDGKSWMTAFHTIQSAIDSIQHNDDIWIKAGVYREQIKLKSYVNLYGGFLGHESSTSERVIGSFSTIIDAGNKGCGLDIAVGAWCIADGLAIKHGKSDKGAGIRVRTNANVNIRNCRIEHCEATQLAGGVYWDKYAQGEMSDCTITYCEAPKGGGMIVEYHSYPTITRVVLARNTADKGGGIYCPFHSGAHLINCTLAYNKADVSGGAAYTTYGGPVTFEHCIFAFNSAPDAGAIFCDGSTSQTTFTYCNLYANSTDDLGGSITWNHGHSNYSDDPLFIAANNNEYHLSPDSTCGTTGAFPVSDICEVRSIGIAKLLPDGWQVSLKGKVVSCALENELYIQEPDRTSGIAVEGLFGLSTDSVVSSITGTLSTNAQGNRVLINVSAQVLEGAVIKTNPLAVSLDKLQLMLGIKLKTWGNVSNITSDGIILSRGITSIPVVYNDSVELDAFVVVTGCYTADGMLIADEVMSQ